VVVIHRRNGLLGAIFSSKDRSIDWLVLTLEHFELDHEAIPIIDSQ